MEIWDMEDECGYMLVFGGTNIKLYSYTVDINILIRMCEELNKIIIQ